MKNIGILTFHAAHNYGSVLQAYATQKAVEDLGYDAEIINFKMKAQDEFYSLYRPLKYGKKNFIYDRLLCVYHKERKEKWDKFEDFIEEMNLSGDAFFDKESFRDVCSKYDCLVSGGDQIWNKYVPELMESKEDYTGVYFFEGIDNHVMSYGSSIGNMKDEDLEKILPRLDNYKTIATREESARQRLTKLTGRDISLVVDPTFLLNKEEWNEVCGKEALVDEPYVLLYSLGKPEQMKLWAENLIPFAEKNNLKVVCLNTFFPIKSDKVINFKNAGPKDFLNLFSNASAVCTDTFHGTAFSLIFRKSFYVLGNKYYKDDIRKQDILKRFDLASRIIEDETDLLKVEDYTLDYTSSNPLIEAAINVSKEYLKNNIE